MNKILITGGAGFIGSNLSNELIDLGYLVFVVDDLSKGKKKNLNQKVNLYKQDINKNGFVALLKKIRPDFIYHLAAQSSLSKSLKNPQEDLEINLLATQQIIKSASKSQIKKIIFASSAAVYGKPTKLPLDEKALKDPVSIYGVSKLSSEYLFKVNYQRNKLPFVCLRFSNVYGENQDNSAEGGVVAIFIKNALSGKVIKIFGKGTQTRDFIYISDVIEANVTVLKSNLIGEFNIGTSHQTSINNIYALIEKIHKEKLQRKYKTLENREVKNSALSYQKFNKATGWVPQVKLEKGLKITYEFFKKKKDSN